MDIFSSAYRIITSGLFLSCFPPFWLYTRMTGQYRDHLKERLGAISRDTTITLTGSPRVWFHAVSLGEVRVAESIIKSLRGIIPECSIILSTTTGHGRDLAVEIFCNEIPVIYAPVDFIGSVRKALYSIRPDILVFMETEIWPNWISEAHRMGVRTALINGRISVRSFNGYLRVKPFFKKVLRDIDVFSMITEEDRERIHKIGADPNKTVVNGNAKYDLLTELADPSTEKEMRTILDLEPARPVFIAGSTRSGEESIIIDAYESILKKFPNTVLIIAPRHIERSKEIASLLKSRGMGYQLWSEIMPEKARRTEQVLIINSFGQLFKLYSIATVAFCGASLVPLGGQNPLEPAVWGKAVFYGPSMEDFLDAKSLLEKNDAAIEIANSMELAEKAIRFIGDRELRKSCGDRAREAVMGNRNAAARHADVIAGLVTEHKSK